MLQDLRSMIGNISISPQLPRTSIEYAEHVAYTFMQLGDLVSFLVDLPDKQFLNIGPTVVRFIHTLEYLAQESHLPETYFDHCHQIAAESHTAIQNKFLLAIPLKRQKKTGRPKT